MKSLFSFDFFGKCNSRFNILLTGPASSGRTAFLLRHLKGRYVDPATTDNIYSAVIERKNYLLNIVDKDIFAQSDQSCDCFLKIKDKNEIEENGHIAKKIGRENKTQSISKNIINNESNTNVDGILFFIDSSDHGRIPLGRRLLLQLIKKASKTPILIIAAKQDVLGALPPGELLAKLNIDDMVNMFEDQVWNYSIVGVSSYTGLGCNEALDRISEAIWKHQLLCYCIPFNRFCYSLCNSSIAMSNF